MDDRRSLYEVTGDIRDVNTMLVPLAELRALQVEATRFRAIKARHAYKLIRTFIDGRGYSSIRAPALIDAWADAAAKEIAEWDSMSLEDKNAWFAEQRAAALTRMNEIDVQLGEGAAVGDLYTDDGNAGEHIRAELGEL